MQEKRQGNQGEESGLMDGRGRYICVPLNQVSLTQRGSIDETVFPRLGKGSLLQEILPE